jgi:hypothetical protein
LHVYVIVNKVMFGREALGIFSSPEKAQKYMDQCAGKTGYFCDSEKSFIRGYYQPSHHVFAAHTYDSLDDVHLLEGIYADLSQAQRAVGRYGQIIEFAIDSPEDKLIFMNE